MVLLFEISRSAIAAIFAAIGEPVELFAFGAGLVVTVGVIRWFVARNSITESTNEEVHEDSVANN